MYSNEYHLNSFQIIQKGLFIQPFLTPNLTARIYLVIKECLPKQMVVTNICFNGAFIPLIILIKLVNTICIMFGISGYEANKLPLRIKMGT